MFYWCPDASFDTHKSIFYFCPILHVNSPFCHFDLQNWGWPLPGDHPPLPAHHLLPNALRDQDQLYKRVDPTTIVDYIEEVPIRVPCSSWLYMVGYCVTQGERVVCVWCRCLVTSPGTGALGLTKFFFIYVITYYGMANALYWILAIILVFCTDRFRKCWNMSRPHVGSGVEKD